jgi:hypothetical protein
VSSYDVEQKKYVTFSTNAIALKWEKVDETTVAMGEFSSDVKLEAHHKDLVDGIRHSHWSTSVLGASRVSSSQTWFLWILLMLCVGLLICSKDLVALYQERRLQSVSYHWRCLTSGLMDHADDSQWCYEAWVQHLMWLKGERQVDLKGMLNPLELPVSSEAQAQLEAMLRELEGSAYGENRLTITGTQQVNCAKRLQREWS